MADDTKKIEPEDEKAPDPALDPADEPKDDEGDTGGDDEDLVLAQGFLEDSGVPKGVVAKLDHDEACAWAAELAIKASEDTDDEDDEDEFDNRLDAALAQMGTPAAPPTADTGGSLNLGELDPDTAKIVKGMYDTMQNQGQALKVMGDVIENTIATAVVKQMKPEFPALSKRSVVTRVKAKAGALLGTGAYGMDVEGAFQDAVRLECKKSEPKAKKNTKDESRRAKVAALQSRSRPEPAGDTGGKGSASVGDTSDKVLALITSGKRDAAKKLADKSGFMAG